ncbi:MAG: (E)-4-hydroxy-3-methylbut-2-enyl-diphosphate synthase [Opitutaceae bacterium]
MASPVPYCLSRFHTLRRQTLEVKVGEVGVGGANPIRLQSMTTSDTQDVVATVQQSIALAEVGCEIVRITAPNVTAAKCLREIRTRFSAAGFARVPLVADIHFLPSAAMEAVEHVEKIRVNPGNYADKKKFAVREYSDADYEEELHRLHDSFSPLVQRCRELGRAMRIGTNHGSLSDRIMNRYGDTPLGMVESALEFLRIARSHRYDQIILSMKASNPKVMIQAYRLLVARMNEEDMHYPLHLGVTEAGDGEDGRIKSAIGIGSLLLDGLGDTIRVSLTEDSVYEIPVARAIADKAMSLWEPVAGRSPPTGAGDLVDPFHFNKRAITAVPLGDACLVGPEEPPRVIVRLSALSALASTLVELASPKLKDTPPEGLLVPILKVADLGELQTQLNLSKSTIGFFVLELARSVSARELEPFLASTAARIVVLRQFSSADGDDLQNFAALVRRYRHTLACNMAPEAAQMLGGILGQLGDAALIFTLDPDRVAPPPGHGVGLYRQLAEALRQAGVHAPLWIRNTPGTAMRGDNSFLSKLLEASFLSGSLLCDGLGDLVSVETEADPTRATKLAYNILQGAGARISKTEFVACPSCGRTLFDLQTTTQRIRERTGHLKGVKIAIMGCIVNGPGEMADADFGYVGGAPGKINLYVGKQCVEYNIPQTHADEKLVGLIKTHGKWFDPEPAPA